MSNIKGTTKAQTLFLRSFRSNPHGPGVEHWPSPAILRRWLRRPGFVQAMQSVREAMQYQADFQLLAAASSAAHVLHTTVVTGEPDDSGAARLKAMSGLMKLAHVRQRFAAEGPPPPVRESMLMEMFCTANPDARISALLHLYESYTGRDLRVEYKARCESRRRADVAHTPIAARPIGGRVGTDVDDAA